MNNLRRFETISDYNAFNNHETLHPLVSVVGLLQVMLLSWMLPLYSIFIFYTW